MARDTLLKFLKHVNPGHKKITCECSFEPKTLSENSFSADFMNGYSS